MTEWFKVISLKLILVNTNIRSNRIFSVLYIIHIKFYLQNHHNLLFFKKKHWFMKLLLLFFCGRFFLTLRVRKILPRQIFSLLHKEKKTHKKKLGVKDRLEPGWLGVSFGLRNCYVRIIIT